MEAEEAELTRSSGILYISAKASVNRKGSTWGAGIPHGPDDHVQRSMTRREPGPSSSNPAPYHVLSFLPSPSRTLVAVG